MVRDKNTIFAEPNDEDTVLMTEDSTELIDNGLIKASGDKFIKHSADDKEYGSILFLVDGQIQELQIQPSKRLGLDANGNLAWV